MHLLFWKWFPLGCCNDKSALNPDIAGRPHKLIMITKVCINFNFYWQIMKHNPSNFTFPRKIFIWVREFLCVGDHVFWKLAHSFLS